MPTPQSAAAAHATREFEAPLFALPDRSGPGRRTLCTAEAVAAMCAHIRVNGISDSAAGYLAGITSSSLSRWKQRYEEVELALGQARAQFEERCIRKISNARKRDGTEDWRALAWLLQHSSPEGYGPKSRRRQGSEAPADQSTALENAAGGDDQADARAAVLEAMNVERVAAFTARQAQATTAEEEAAILPEIQQTALPQPPAAGSLTQPGGGGFEPEKKRAILPEIHQPVAVERFDRVPHSTVEACLRAIRPATAHPEPSIPTAPKSSRQERRAAERRLMKEKRKASRAVA